MFRTVCFFTIVGSLTFAVGCGKTPAQIADQVTGKSKETRDQLGMSGDWETQCAKSSGLPQFKSEKERYHFGDNGSFQKKFYFYSDDTCHNPSYVRQEDGTMKFQSSATPKEGLPTDFSFTKVSIVPDNQNAVDDLNHLNYCGITNYAVGQASDVTANSSNALCVGITHTPRTTYDVIKLLDDNHVVFGDDAKQEDPTKRPTTINQSLVFTKQ